MNRLLASYFFYTRSERRGVLVLLAISAGFLLVPQFYKAFVRRSDSTDFTAFQASIAAFAARQDSDTEGGHFDQNQRETKHQLFTFNPNDVTFDELVQLGLPPRVARTWTNYTAKGGHFRQKDDIKRVYGLTKRDFDRLENYIEIENDDRTTSFDTKKLSNSFPLYKRSNEQFGTSQPIVLQNFDPNTASDMVLLGLGLEEKTVKNLLKYREKGGRFRTKKI
jgi:DNA uptake protein ComE-like DNA-binding protein